MASGPGGQEAVTQASGTMLLKRAVELDTERRYTESLMFYQSGIQQLMEVLRGITEEAKRQHYRQKISEYMDRAEKIKQHVDQEKDAGKYHEQIRIEANSIGHSHHKIFGPFIDEALTMVSVEDPYIRNFHQIQNFVRLCELLVSAEKSNVRKVHLVTGVDEQGQDASRLQQERLTELQKSLAQHNVQLEVQYSDTLHDREIRFNNGWIIKIGRGLDYFKAAAGKFSLGFSDFNLRPCHETTVDIFHSKHTKHKGGNT